MGKRFVVVSVALTLTLVLTGVSYGEGVSVKLTPTGYASYEVGQIVQADSLTAGGGYGYQCSHLLYQRSFVGFNLQAAYDPLPITTNIGVELKSFTETPREAIASADQGIHDRFFYFFYLTRGDFVYSPSEAFNLDVGYFPVKYNEDARNLGEYLLRSGTYPQYLITNFDFAATRVTGVNAYGTLFGNLNYKALLTINTENATMGDLNLTGLASYSLFNRFLEFGGGVSFSSFISANTNHTQPKILTNEDDLYPDKNGNVLYVTPANDTIRCSNYTFAGTKLMGRLSIDPKALLPGDITGMMGKEDLKLYSEAAILGVRNYPISVDTSSAGTRYDDILKRIPVMFGFNFPTFKILDVLSLEAEWFGSHYPNDESNYVLNGMPSALGSKWNGGGYSMFADSTKDNWKWSIYAKKTFAGHFNVVVQAASDHLHWDQNAYGDQAYVMSEALTQPKEWYYVVKVGYSF